MDEPSTVARGQRQKASAPDQVPSGRHLRAAEPSRRAGAAQDAAQTAPTAAGPAEQLMVAEGAESGGQNTCAGKEAAGSVIRVVVRVS